MKRIWVAPEFARQLKIRAAQEGKGTVGFTRDVSLELIIQPPREIKKLTKKDYGFRF